MSRRFLTHTLLACAMSFGLMAGTFAQSASDDAKKAGKAAEKVGKDTAEATEDSSKAAAKTAKKTGKVIKKAVTPGTGTALCKDGTVQKGKTKAVACDGHGGVD